MNTRRRRLHVLLALAVVCSSSSLRAAVVAPVSLAPALGMIQSVPAFRASVLSQISLVSSLSVQAHPSLLPLASAAPLPSNPWHAESARFVGALVAQPQAVALHLDELNAALGVQQTESLRKAAKDLQASAAKDSALQAQLNNLRSGLDLTDAGAVQELGTRLNALFENSKRRENAPGGTVLASDAAKKQQRIPDSWKSLKPAGKSDARTLKAVAKINDYLDKEREAPLGTVEINDLTAQFEHLAGLPDKTIPVELLGHLEGLSIATRELFKKGPEGRNVKALVTAAEKLRAKVVAESRTGRAAAAAPPPALPRLGFSDRVPEPRRPLLQSVLKKNAASVLPLVVSALEDYNRKYGGKATLEDLDLYAHYYNEGDTDHVYQVIIEKSGQRIGIFVAYIDKTTHRLTLGANDD